MSWERSYPVGRNFSRHDGASHPLNPIKVRSMKIDRKNFIATALGVTAGCAFARDWTGAKPTRYPDPDVLALDPSFGKYRLGNASIRRVYTSPDMLWAE